MSHVETYLGTDAARKSVFWHMLFPLWFGEFPTANGVPPSSLWSSNNESANNDDDTPDTPRKGKKKTMAQMSPDEAVIQVSALLTTSHSAQNNIQQSVKNFFYAQQVKNKKVNGNPWKDLVSSLSKPARKPVKLPLFRFMMSQDDYRPLVEQEYDETWDAEEYDEATKLAWRCKCARVVLSRVEPDELARLEKAREEYTAVRLDEWTKSNAVEGGEGSEDSLAMYA